MRLAQGLILGLACIWIAAAAFTLLGCDDDDDSGSGAADSGGDSTADQAGDNASGDGAVECTVHETSFEGCQLMGCDAGPVDLTGTTAAGGACEDAFSCEPTLCSCPRGDSVVEWWAADCACDACSADPCDDTRELMECDP